MINDQGIFKPGDLVIGSSDPSKSVYSASGARLIKDGVSIYGAQSQEVLAQQEALEKSIARNGGVPVDNEAANKKKKTKQNKKYNEKTSKLFAYDNGTSGVYADHNHEAEEPIAVIKEYTVQFENDFGKMKAKVESVIQHDMAFMLVFKNEDAVVFEPKTGESLKFYNTDRLSYDVYYPGVTFDSQDSDRKFMILFKIPTEGLE